MSGNYVIIIFGVLSIIIGVIALVLRIIIARKIDSEILRDQKIYDMRGAMDLARRQNPHDARLTLSCAGFEIPKSDKISEFILPDLFWETKSPYMALTLITLANLYIAEHASNIVESGRDTMVVTIFREFGKQIMEFAQKDTNQALGLVVELAIRDKRATQGLNYCFLGNSAPDIYN